MPSAQHEAMVQMLLSQRPEGTPTLEETRERFEQMASLFPVPEDVTREAVDAGGVPAEWLAAPGASPSRVILYLHGGGYVIGSIATHRSLLSRLSRASGARGLSVGYRLAPEHPFPAAVEDATTAYRWLLASGVSPGSVVVAGDSAGGGLTLATLLALRDAGDRLPAAAVCMSPWTDLEGTGASAQPGGADDPLLDLEGLREMGRHYAGSDLTHPLAAPLHADYAGLPPILIQVGTREILLDDSRRVAERARKAGVDLTLDVWDGLIHVWQMFGAMGVPESDQAIEKIGEFVRKHTS
ncbi:MAG: alpha/beta hydrolase [Myxococcota bacterium]